MLLTCSAFDQAALEEAIRRRRLVLSGEQLGATEALLLVGFQTSEYFLWPVLVGLEKLKETKAKQSPGHIKVITT